MIRPARPADAPAIAAIWNPVIRDTGVTVNTTEKSLDAIEAAMAPPEGMPRGMIVAEDAGELIGFAALFPYRPGNGYRHTGEHTIILAPGARGRGAGRALMAALEEMARAQGVHRLFAYVSGENPAGVTFHAACGFETLCVLPEVGRKFDRWHDVTVMLKKLDTADS
ncbi:GNAT family N-acetyltransferase [Oceanomicrobium pacificus]|uniref:GNAT family N-acetyltransferase n=1 Tax=Oceanomicrobium pacificus TaxID=2692916 RepID=A0A6B0TN21_9RHOB|nr:GNAT family N-acetyltransferase [Oceanomicrobium pacificus]